MNKLIYQSNKPYLNRLPSSLTQLEDRSLLEIIQNPEEKESKRKLCMEVLYLRHIALVKNITKKHCNGQIIPDCFMRASYGLCYAAGRFDLSHEKKVLFTTYAFNWIRKECQRWLNSESKRGLTSFTDDYRELLGVSVDKTDTRRDIELATSKLSPEDQHIVHKFYYGKFRIRDIAKENNVPEKSVRKRLKYIREVLKKELKEGYGSKSF